MTFNFYHVFFSFIFGVAFGGAFVYLFFTFGQLSIKDIDRKEYKKLTGKDLNKNLGSKKGVEHYEQIVV